MLYETATVPVPMPAIVPVPETVAIDGSAELQIPPGVGSVRIDVEPMQTKAVPAIAAGLRFTFIKVVELALPQLLDIV